MCMRGWLVIYWFGCVSGHTNSCGLLNANSYIYIYVCVCVCVCVDYFTPILIYIYMRVCVWY